MKYYTKIGLILLPILVATLLCGCSTVTITQPLTKDPKPINQEEFEGVWILEDQSIHIKFGSDGIARIATLEWKDDRFELKRGEMIVTPGKAHNFLSVRFQEDGEWESRYHFLPYKFTDQGDLVLWPPKIGEFEKAVAKQQLKGSIKKGEHSTHVTITDAPDKVLEFINAPDKMNLFKYRDPLVLHKLPGKEED